jgi:hypothetical protein
MGCGRLAVWPSKLHSGRSPLLLLVALLLEVLFPSLHALLLSVHGHSVASLRYTSVRFFWALILKFVLFRS